MSVAPILPPTIMPSPRRPGEAVVIPFPGPRDAPDEPLAVPIPLRPRRPVRSAGPRPGLTGPPVPVDPVAPAGPAESGCWPGARLRVVRPAQRPRPVGLRLTRRGRLVLVTATLLAVTGFGWLAVRVVHTQTAIPPSAPAVVEVQPGETLWSIAERIAPHADTRAVVDAIAARNGLSAGVVQPGQRLRIQP